MIRIDPGPVGRTTAAPVLVCLLGESPSDEILRFSFDEALSRETALDVLLTGPASSTEEDVLVLDVIERWAEKYPTVPVTTRVRRGVDAAVTLTAATRGHSLAVLPVPANARTAAVLVAVSRRTHCPVTLISERGDGRHRPAGRPER